MMWYYGQAMEKQVSFGLYKGYMAQLLGFLVSLILSSSSAISKENLQSIKIVNTNGQLKGSFLDDIDDIHKIRHISFFHRNTAYQNITKLVKTKFKKIQKYNVLKKIETETLNLKQKIVKVVNKFRMSTINMVHAIKKFIFAGSIINQIVLQCINMAFIISEEFIKKAIINSAQDQKCIDLHAGSCTLKALQQLKLGTKSIAPLYFVIHLVPMLLKYKKVARNPTQQIKKFLKGFLKSLLFVASTLFTIRRGICFTTQFYKYTNLSASLTGLICGFPLMLQSPGRQIEMALYTVNKSVEQLYFILRRRYPNLYIRYGQGWVFAVSASILSFFYINHRNYFRQTYQKTLDLFFAEI